MNTSGETEGVMGNECNSCEATSQCVFLISWFVIASEVSSQVGFIVILSNIHIVYTDYVSPWVQEVLFKIQNCVNLGQAIQNHLGYINDCIYNYIYLKCIVQSKWCSKNGFQKRSK